MNRWRRGVDHTASYLAVGVVIVLIFGGVMAVLLLITVVLPGGTAPFSGGSFTKVERSLQAKGLHICHTEYRKPGVTKGSAESKEFSVAYDCESGNVTQVVVSRYDRRNDRDSALSNLETLIRPDSGASFSYGRFSVFVSGDRHDKAHKTADQALRDIGAK